MAAPPTSAIADYVRSSARLLDLPLSDPQVERVGVHLERSSAIAALLNGVPFGPADEIAEIFRPAPFPAEDPR
jgi:hypothetical protein